MEPSGPERAASSAPQPAERRHLLVVAMNYAPEPSGTAPYTTALVAHLARRHRVTALVGVPHYPRWRVEPGYEGWRRRTEHRDGAEVVRLRHHVPSATRTLDRLLHETSYAVRVAAQRTGPIDAVIAVTPPLFGLAAARWLARRRRVPWGVVVQDLYSAGTRELGGGGAAVAASAAVESRLLRAADQVSVIHDTFRTTLVERLGVPAARVGVIPNWTHAAPAGTPRAQVRARMGWGSETIALHAGNMGSKQGLETLVAAARRVDERDLPLRFVLMGDGNQRARLQELAAPVRSLTFLGSVADEDYGDVLAAADVLVVNERPGVAGMSVPSKLTSYFAAGRPVLAACDPSGATAEMVRRAGGGVVVPAGADGEVVAGLLDLRADAAGAARLARAGQDWAHANLAAGRTLQQYDAWVDRLLSGGH